MTLIKSNIPQIQHNFIFSAQFIQTGLPFIKQPQSWWEQWSVLPCIKLTLSLEQWLVLPCINLPLSGEQ